MARPRTKPLTKDPVLLEFGHRIREERTARGWTQAVLAEKIGVNRTYMGSIERGEKNVGLLIINRLTLILSEAAIGFKACRLKRLPPPRPKKRIRK